MARHTRIKITKNKEEWTKDISKMISEGGLGADFYYDIRKRPQAKTEE